MFLNQLVQIGVAPVDVGEYVDDCHHGDQGEAREGRDGEATCRTIIYIARGVWYTVVVLESDDMYL